MRVGSVLAGMLSKADNRNTQLVVLANIHSREYFSFVTVGKFVAQIRIILGQHGTL